MKKVYGDADNGSFEELARLNMRLDNLLKFERLVSNLSARIINTAEDSLDTEIDHALSQIIDFLGIDRGGLLELLPDKSTWMVAYAAFADGIPTVPMRTLLPASLFPWIYRRVVEHQDVVQFMSLDDLPPDAETDKKTYMEWKTKSALHIPIIHLTSHVYMISVNAIRTEMIWSDEYVARLRLFGEILVNALVRRESLQAERAAAERHSAMIAAAPDAITLANADGSIVFASPKALHMFGHQDIAEVLGRNVLEWIDPEDHGRAQEKIVKIMEGKPTELAEYCLIRKDGSRFVGEISASRMLDTAGTPWGLMVFTRDISARKLMEQQLRERISEVERLKNLLEDENAYLMLETMIPDRAGGIIGESDAIKYVLFRRRQIDSSDTTVLIMGETGTGKGLFAREIHKASMRRDKPFVIVNCGALPGNLIESELFGRERGAFTGAESRQIGRFELAHEGTIFLDEIGELPLDLQAKLLRVLEDGEFERLGSPHTVYVNVRIIASTNRNLEQEIKAGRFREDLYYRLHVFPITIPPLRKRKDDIPLLVNFFVAHFNKKHAKRIQSVPQEIMHALEAYSWPGNVRELMNVIERAVITSPNSVLKLADKIERTETARQDTRDIASMADAERTCILSALENTGWKLEGPSGAAQILAMHPSTLRSRMRKLNITRPKH